ncbi:MAG TPA: hypothetical protein ENK43_13510 [Planctomycetes bacterium]|nr:hypothetical protein [Planctomycetota bacterium]
MWRRCADGRAARPSTSSRPPTPGFSGSGWRLGKPDLEFVVPEPFVVPADGEDIYRYFVIPMDLTRDLDVVAFDSQPGDPSGRCCELYLTIAPDDPKSLRALERASLESWFRSSTGGSGPPWRGLGK